MCVFSGCFFHTHPTAGHGHLSSEFGSLEGFHCKAFKHFKLCWNHGLGGFRKSVTYLSKMIWCFRWIWQHFSVQTLPFKGKKSISHHGKRKIIDSKSAGWKGIPKRVISVWESNFILARLYWFINKHARWSWKWCLFKEASKLDLRIYRSRFVFRFFHHDLVEFSGKMASLLGSLYTFMTSKTSRHPENLRLSESWEFR